jgi:hypothetical protein
MHEDQLHQRAFEELLDAEVFVNSAKLREAARQGVPEAYRGTVYRYLLGIISTDKSSEMTFEQMQDEDFALLESSYVALNYHSANFQRSNPSAGAPTTATGVIANASNVQKKLRQQDFWMDVWAKGVRHTPPYDDGPRRKRLESTWRAIQMSHPDASAEDVRHILALAKPFDHISQAARDTHHCVEALLAILRLPGNSWSSRTCLTEHCGLFLCLFHHINENLYTHFIHEGVDALEWLPGMLRTLLAAHLHLEDTLRLWDTYLADAMEATGFPLHPYVCLALLTLFTEELLEMDGAEVLRFLRELPRVDVEALLQKAIALREEVTARELT